MRLEALLVVELVSFLQLHTLLIVSQLKHLALAEITRIFFNNEGVLVVVTMDSAED